MAREFWLDYDAEQIGLQAVNGGRSTAGLTHVIEYSAYQKLETKCDNLIDENLGLAMRAEDIEKLARQMAFVIEIYVRAKSNNLIVPSGPALEALEAWLEWEK